MRKKLLLTLALCLCITMLAGCNAPGTSNSSQQSTAGDSSGQTSTIEEKKPLRVAVMSFYCSSLIDVILKENWPEKDNLPIEYLMFSNGATINEAMGEWDVAITGGAFIYSLANYDCKLIAHQIDGSAGNDVHARVGDEILNTYGAVVEGVAGTPEIAEGKTYLTAFGTTSHYTLLQWMQAIGADPNKCNLVNQDQATVYQSWVAGEGDYCVLTAPYCFYDWEGTSEVVATLKDVGGQLLESCVVTKEAYESRYDDIVTFTEWIYRATDKLAADEDYAFDIVKNYYKNAGKELSDADINAELTNKPFITSKDAKELNFGDFAIAYGEYYISQGMIDPEKLDVIKANIAYDVHDDALSRFQ
jgi:ABC-type nitrate/sulfonate/bicarbonate transport system substrate-binding protein